MTKKLLLILVAIHLIGFVGLMALGVWIESIAAATQSATTPKRWLWLTWSQWGWVWTVLSTAGLIYTWVFKQFFDRSPAAQMLWYKVKTAFKPTHTHWRPAFNFTINSEEASQLKLEDLATSLGEAGLGKVIIRDQTTTTMTADIADLGVMFFRLKDTILHICADRELLVPSHLYETYETRLQMFLEKLRSVLRPVELSCNLTVSFKDGNKNPYYGLFVHSVPPEALKTFNVIFSLKPESSCRIEAHKDSVVVEGSNATETFQALSHILHLRALPGATAG